MPPSLETLVMKKLPALETDGNGDLLLIHARVMVTDLKIMALWK